MEEESVSRKHLHLDQFSELPDLLIHRILSFLPIRDVVSTTLLSKRWEDLWTTIPCLNFSDFTSVYDNEEDELVIHHQVRNFVNRALMFWKGTELTKFIIDIDQFFDESLIGDMNLWVQYAVKRKVEELNISLKYDIMDLVEGVVYMVPQCLISCSSVRKLSLVGCDLRIHRTPVWDQLKSLKMDGFSLSEELINQILLGSPQLEELNLCFWENNGNLNIWSSSLRKLKIIKNISNVTPSLDTVLRINCPNLGTLKISGAIFYKCLFTDLSSLTDATLVFSDIRYMGNSQRTELLRETMRHVFSTFQHVEKITLRCFEVLKLSMKENLLSPLPNVVFLKLEAFASELVGIVDLLEVFPNLKMLVFKDRTFGPDDFKFETGISKSVLLQLKIIEITSKFCDSSILWFIEFFLKHCSMLEKMVVRHKCSVHPKQENLLQITETLLSMPRSSPTAKVIFKRE